MRISDWSSDVCSSDLPFGLVLGQGQHGRDGFALRKRQEVDHRSAARRGPALGQAPYLHAIDLARGREEEDGGMRRGDEKLGDDILVLRRHAGATLAAATLGAEGSRKSVVEGKGVSGRVDLGGRRRLKKKKTKKT